MTTEAHILANLPICPPLYICKETSTNPPPFMQNKPNFLNNQRNISPVMTKHYGYKMRLCPPAKQTQFKANQTQFSNPAPIFFC